MISLKNVSFAYDKKSVLTDISINIKSGSLTALIGLNGAGKSTLLGCLSKQYNVSKGEIKVNGKIISEYSYREYAKIVSLVPQLSSVYRTDSQVRDFLVEGRTPHLSAFSVPGIEEYRFSEKIAKTIGISDYLGSDFSKLSGGQQQMVLLARALIQDTPVLLLDEPMSALDLKNQSFMLKMIQHLSNEGKTILFSTHNPNHALMLGCDVVLLYDGMVISHDSANEAITESNLFQIFGNSVKLAECDGEKTTNIVI